MRLRAIGTDTTEPTDTTFGAALRLASSTIDKMVAEQEASPGNEWAHAQAWQVAMEAADGDWRRIARLTPTELVVFNTPGEPPAWLLK